MFEIPDWIVIWLVGTIITFVFNLIVCIFLIDSHVKSEEIFIAGSYCSLVFPVYWLLVLFGVFDFIRVILWRKHHDNT